MTRDQLKECWREFLASDNAYRRDGFCALVSCHDVAIDFAEYCFTHPQKIDTWAMQAEIDAWIDGDS